MKSDLLLLCKLYPHTMAQLDATYNVHRYYEAADKEAFVAATADKITAAATSGGDGMKGELMARYPKLKMIGNYGVGYDGVDIAAAAARGIAVTNTPDVLNECVADTTWMLILATVRRAIFNDRYVRSGKWAAQGGAPLTDKVWGEKIGIVGLGRIGKAIAKRAEGFGMQIVYHGRNQQKDVAYPYYASLTEMAREVKILVCIMPGGKANEKMIGKEVIDALGTKGTLINVSRGTNVDQDYLLDALQNKRIAGAGLDVFAKEPQVPEGFFALDNVVLQPHVGSGTTATRQAMGQCVVDNLAAYFSEKPLLTRVPETPA